MGRGLILPEEDPDPFIIIFRRVDGIDDGFISRDERVMVHPGNKIHAEIGIASSDIFDNPTFVPKAFI